MYLTLDDGCKLFGRKLEQVQESIREQQVNQMRFAPSALLRLVYLAAQSSTASGRRNGPRREPGPAYDERFI